MIKYLIISPDGFPTFPEPYEAPEETFEQASKAKLDEWVKSYERQGYYSSVKHGRIPMDQIASYCIIETIDERKGMTVEIYRRAGGIDCTNYGISSRVDKFTLIGPDIPELISPSKSAPAIKIVEKEAFQRQYQSAYPDGYENKAMFGGNFIYSSDSRFPYPYPVKIHDRIEN